MARIPLVQEDDPSTPGPVRQMLNEVKKETD